MHNSGDTVRVIVKVLNTETFRVKASTRISIPKVGAFGGIFGDANTGPIRNVGDFVFELRECYTPPRTGRTLTCWFLISNTTNSVRLTLSTYSRARDSAGTEYRASDIGFGLSTPTIIVDKVPRSAFVKFYNVPPDTAKLSLLEILASHSGSVFKPTWRGVPVGRKEVIQVLPRNR